MIDLQQLASSVRFLGRAGLPVVALAAMLIVVLQGLYVVNPLRATVTREASIDHFVVDEQLVRSTIVRSDVAFLGDSSCLMGADAGLISAELGVAVESFCTLAAVGPTGYARMLERMIDAETVPRQIVLILHPVQFQRVLDWDSWLPFVANGGFDYLLRQPGFGPSFPVAALDYLRFEWLGRALYSPLPGRYGIFYGSADEFRGVIRSSNGSAVDPGNLTYFTLEEAAVSRLSRQPIDLALTEAFRASLRELAPVLARLGTERVHVVVTPVPQAVFLPFHSRSALAAAILDIINLLGLPPQNVIETPATYPDGYFSSDTHLSRLGRLAFSRDLADALRSIQ